MKIKQVLPVGFGVIAVVILIQNVIFQQAAKNLRETSKWVAHTNQVQGFLEGVEKTLVEAETGQRGFLYSGEENYLEPYNGAISKIDGDFETLKQEISDNPAQVKRLSEVEQLAEKKLEELQETIELKKAGREEELRDLVLSGQGKQLMDDLRNRISEMIEVEEELLAQRQEDAEQAYKLIILLAWGGLATVVFIGIVILIVMDKIAIKPINQIANTVASSASEIVTTIEQQEKTASFQASSVNETTSTMDELGTSSKQSSQQAEAAANAAKHALMVAGEGNDAVTETLQGMADLKEQVGAIANQILKLSEETNQIGNISQLVSDIANQTNMLALNAAVEAVRAGEHGKGFSVVAAEIRKLAEQSKQSGDKINTLVSNIQNSINTTLMVTNEGRKKVDSGMKTTQKTTKAFEDITEAVNNVVINNQQISLNVKQQAIAINQVLEAMSSVNQGAQETAMGIGQTRVSADQLNLVASQLKTIV